MADGNYDEVTNTVYQGESRENIDPMFHWDSHFPERISRLRLNAAVELSSPASRRQRRPRDRCAVRYKTQPITFDEITEVEDEDTSGGASSGGATAAAAVQPENPEVTAEMKINFKNTMTGFSRSMDGLVAGGGGTKKGGTGSDKENTPCEGDRLSRPTDQSAEAEGSSRGPTEQTKDRGVTSASVECFRSVGCPLDGVRHRRKKMNRKLHYRNTVEEVPEPEKVEETENAA